MNLIPIAWQGVRGFPIRAALTVLGLMIGILGLVSVYSASETTIASVRQRAILANGPVSTFHISGLTGQLGLERGPHLREQLIRSLGSKTTGALTAVTSVTKLELSGHTMDIDIVYTEPNLRDIRDFPILSGRWLDTEYTSEIGFVLNEAALQANHGLSDQNPAIQVQGNTYPIPTKVIGVIKDGNPRPFAYASIEHLPSLLINQENAITASIEVSSPRLNAPGIMTRLNEIDSYSGSHTSWSVTRRDTVEQLAAEVSVTQSSFLTIGLLGLISAGFAVSNVGLSALRERASELSLRRAIGGQRWQISILMILESQIVAVMAGIVAAPLSFLTYPLIASQFGAPFGVAPPPYPWPTAILGLGLGMFTSLLGSVAPAIRALNTPISAIMRE